MRLIVYDVEVFCEDWLVVFKDTETGQTYRVTSKPEEKVAPRSSTLPLKYFTAERWALTT